MTCPTDGKTASDTVNIQVVAAPVAAPIVFEDVHFDFDRYSLRPEAVRTLDEAVAVLQRTPTSASDRRAHLQHRHGGIQPGARRAPRQLGARLPRRAAASAPSRFRTVSYGEERPKYDNAREETRRLNRRAALVVRCTR